MLVAIERIEQRTVAGRSSLDDELVQVWVLHHLEVLGEAARGISAELRERHDEIAWRAIIGLRNVVAHGYFGVDVERVWMTVERNIPALKAQITATLADLAE